MKTPLQELFEIESDLTNMFDSDAVVAGAILEYIRTNKKDMLEKEKQLLKDVYEDGREEEYDFFVNALKRDSFEDYYNNIFEK